jgi:hypothetical protein
MKTLKQSLLILAVATTLFACKKENANKITDEIRKTEIQKKQIQDIIPTQYLDSLKKLGLNINTGISPINVEGYYAVNPLLLSSTNILNDFKIGYRFNDARLKLSNQDENFNIKLIGKNFLATSDTSIVTAISGIDKDITIYGKVKSVKNGKTADFAIIISCTVENGTFKNFKYGLICTSNKNPSSDANFIKEGQGRVVYESDNSSTIILEKDFLATLPNHPFLNNISSGLIDKTQLNFNH